MADDLAAHFAPPGPPYDPQRFPPPPPWPLGPDPRTPDCQHRWDGYWGVKGERQRLCRYCGRYVWESQIEPRDSGAT